VPRRRVVATQYERQIDYFGDGRQQGRDALESPVVVGVGNVAIIHDRHA
jgi:hypothetical protein